jgi:hypothetical protein
MKRKRINSLPSHLWGGRIKEQKEGFSQNSLWLLKAIAGFMMLTPVVSPVYSSNF